MFWGFFPPFFSILGGGTRPPGPDPPTPLIPWGVLGQKGQKEGGGRLKKQQNAPCRGGGSGVGGSGRVRGPGAAFWVLFLLFGCFSCFLGRFSCFFWGVFRTFRPSPHPKNLPPPTAPNLARFSSFCTKTGRGGGRFHPHPQSVFQPLFPPPFLNWFFSPFLRIFKHFFHLFSAFFFFFSFFLPCGVKFIQKKKNNQTNPKPNPETQPMKTTPCSSISK